MTTKENKKNKKFWTLNPMTYVDFKKPLSERLPKEKKHFDIINKKLIISNPDFLSIIRKYKKNIKGKIVLDLGCGFGASTVILSKFAKKIFAIDLTLPAIKNAKKNIKINKIKNVNLKQMDAENLDFKNDYFDFVFSWGVIHHSHNPTKILMNIKKKLKKNGSCFIMVYNLLSFRYIFLSIYYLFLKGYIFRGHNFTSICKKFTDGHYNKHYSVFEMKKVLREIGYKNIKISYGHHKGRILPFFKSHNTWLGKFFSRYFGYFLYAYFEKN
tara:strand:+ start:2648 stop:3457 length:810 start_codon:yes stop_codon:yes gene_type:complete